MAANASVTLDVTANTAAASKGVEELRKKFQVLQKEAAARADTLGGKWAAASSRNKLGVVAGLATGGVELASALMPQNSTGSNIAKGLAAAATGAKQFGMMLAPLGPTGVATGAAIGVVTGALKTLGETSREAAKKAEEEARAAKKRGLRHNDAVGEERWQWENADAVGRGKMQAEARERIRKARWKLQNGMSVSESDVYGVANWDRSLALQLGAAAKRQNGGQTPEGLRVLMGQLQGDAYSELTARNKWKWGGAKYMQAVRMEEAAEKEGRVGRRGEARAFDERYDAAYANSLEKPGNKGVSNSLRLPNFSSGSAVDSLSSIGIGYTGSGDKSAEMVDLLRRIADSTSRAVSREQTLVLK